MAYRPSQAEAAGFLAEARVIFQLHSKNFRGRHGLKKPELEHINTSLRNLFGEAGFSNGRARKLCRRFQEMCRRCGIDIPEELRAPLTLELIREFFANAENFGASDARIHKLIPVTLYHGDIHEKLQQHSQTQGKHLSRGFLKYAVMHYPADPFSYVQNALLAEEEITQEAEFADLARTRPGLCLHAVQHYPSDPRAFLRKVQAGEIGWLIKKTTQPPKAAEPNPEPGQN